MKRLSWFFVIGSLLVSLQAQGEQVGLRLDVHHYDVEVSITPEDAYIEGRATIHFTVLEDSVSLPFSLNSRVTLVEVMDEEGVVYSQSYDNLNSSRMLIKGIETFRAGDRRQLTFRFDGTLEPEEYAYLDDSPRTEKAVISQDGAVLLSEGIWFPSHELAVDPATATLQVSVPLGFTVVAPGELQPVETIGVQEVFRWESQEPLNHVPVLVARYIRTRFSKDAKFTFFSTDEDDVDLQPLAEQMERVLAYYEKRYGPSPAFEHLTLVTVGNVELPSTGTAGLILLDRRFLSAKAVPLTELARRLALQWWSYPIQLQAGYDAWLRDGFAMYAAIDFIEQNEPDRFAGDLARLATDALKYEERAPTIEGYSLGQGTPEYESVVVAKGAWVLYMLRQLVGNENFSPLFIEWHTNAVGARSVTSAQFVDFVNDKTGKDYNWFFLQWVESTGVPEFQVEYAVFKLSDGTFKIRGEIAQDQELFQMPTEVEIQTKGETEAKNITLKGKSTPFAFETQTMPLKILLDPKGKILRDSEQMRVLVHVALGEEYQTDNEYVSAIREFEKAAMLDERNSMAHFRLGETYFLQHSYSNAANAFKDALNGTLQPPWVETWSYIHLGKIYDVLGQRQRALAEYRKAQNTRIDFNGAQAEAEKYLNEPYSRPRTMIN